MDHWAAGGEQGRCRSRAGRGHAVVCAARIAVAAQSIEIGAVLVQAKDEAAKGFYQACAEFLKYPADRRKLFLPIETVVAAFG